MRISVFLSIAALFIAGCTTIPPLPKIEFSRGDHIGLLVEGGDNPTHTHIGTTIFNNFTKKYSYNWDLNTELTRTIEKTIRNKGLTAVDLRKEGLTYADVSDLIQAAGDKWQIAPGKENIIRRLREQFRLKGLIILKESRVITGLECFGGPCSVRYADGAGLYTRSFLGITGYLAVTAYQWNFFVLDPFADVTKVNPLLSMLRMPVSRMSDFKDPVNFYNLTEEEFKPVRNAILRFTETASEEAVKAFNVK